VRGNELSYVRVDTQDISIRDGRRVAGSGQRQRAKQLFRRNAVAGIARIAGLNIGRAPGGKPREQRGG
jgi:hypothetical protein